MKKGEDCYVHNDIEHSQKKRRKGETTSYVHNDIEHLKKPKSKYMIFKQQVYTNQKGC